MSKNYTTDELDLSYIAGYIDGEGCISSVITSKNKKHKGGDRVHVYLTINIVITNTDFYSLNWIKEVLDCGVGW